MKTKKMWIIGILVTLLAVPIALAQDGRPGPRGRTGHGDQRGPRDGQGFRPERSPQGRPQGGPAGGFIGVDMERHIQMISRVAELTPEQEEAVTDIVEKNRAIAEENQIALQKAMQALREAVLEGDPENVEARCDALAKAIAKQATHNAKTIKAVNQELTPEQVEKLKAFRTRMQERMQQNRQQRNPQIDGQALDDDELAPAPKQRLRPRQGQPRPPRDAQ